MNPYSIKILHKLRQIYHNLFLQKKGLSAHSLPINIEGQAASDEIKKILETGKPTMITRFGSSEIDATLIHYYGTKKYCLIKKYYLYITGKIEQFWWDKNKVLPMINNAGFFPEDISLLEGYGERILKDIKEINILGSWTFLRKKEISLQDYFPKSIHVPAQYLEPYYHENPWTSVLEGKKVLVIHPFEESIKAQYLKREHLFSNPRILPPFELKTIKAVQSIAFSESEYKNWFEALDGMCKKIDQSDFDIAIIGCGAYGLPLAAHVKRKGKQAVHLGGATQILFGIKGKRWEDSPFFQTVINEFWTSPLETETPKNHSNVEGGCYW